MLQLKNVIKRFGGLVAVDNLSCTVGPGEILGIIGPNGAGKTTLLNCISGIYTPDGGEIRLREKVLNHLKPFQINKLGVGRTFQVARLFRKCNLIENVMAPALDSGVHMQSLREKALELLEYVGLKDLKEHFGEELSGGQQKLLEFARILMFNPDMILLDEPFAGVHPDIKGKLHERICELHAVGKSFILVSHDMEEVYALSTRILAMHNGQKIAEGNHGDIVSDQAVMEAYLGG